ncbi:trihelix transcription factor DF1-like isoform X2 [Telopea speciosissima]|uniref:trihelix transcription factor DF1-like isoform X2 n=1 Tax=Telopea speciosissima TaxID=54955 RepID=UPI001CC33640|nr:trihelix transcription factor DF1-like isoform X2 [Telopea speciosissima]
MLGVSDSSGNSSGATAAAAGNHEGDVGVGVGVSITVPGDSASGSGLGEEEKLRGEEGDRNSAGNRWPRQETLALLQIRSDMDVAFRDSTVKGPLWEEVSRKLADLGFHRSGKKCKEKFENVYKYHRRIKEGRASRADGKTYRFFDQLQALDHHHPSLLPPLSPSKPLQSQSPAAPPPRPPPMLTTTATPLTAAAAAPPPNVSIHTTTPTATATATTTPTTTTTTTTTDPMSTSSMDSSSSSEDESGGSRSRRRKRKKMTAFFEKLMNEVIEKQEMLQKKFLETIEKRERERVAREEAWKVQEMARMNREHELMLHERSIAAAKDAAVIAFLKKISEQASAVQSTELQLQLHEAQIQNPKPNPSKQPAQPVQPLNQAQPSPDKMMVEIPRPASDNAADSFAATSSSLSSRWPKPEVQALIRLRTNLDLKYQENGPKGPLWEEISASMRKLGYNRNAKRCKEKWENINKYFKKVKESNKKRPEDSKTCPYFHQLDALYKERSHHQTPQQQKPENMVMPLRQEPIRPQSDIESENNMDMEMEMDRNQEQDDEDGDDEVEDEGGDYEIVANNSSSVAIVE